MQSGESRQNLSKETHRPLVKHLEHFVRLSREARSDIEWWFQFSSDWNGVTMIRRGQTTGATMTLTSDASGGWAYWDSLWFMLPWTGPITECHITAKELVPIVAAATL